MVTHASLPGNQAMPGSGESSSPPMLSFESGFEGGNLRAAVQVGREGRARPDAAVWEYNFHVTHLSDPNLGR